MTKQKNFSFTNITPKTIKTSTTALSASVAYFKNRIFLAVACIDADEGVGIYELLCNENPVKSWNTLFKQGFRLNCPITSGRTAGKPSKKAGKIRSNNNQIDSLKKLIKAEIKILPPDNSIPPTLYFHLKSDSESLLFQLDQNDKIVQITQPTPALSRFFSFQPFVNVRDRTYALKWDKRTKRKLIYRKLYGKKQWRKVNTEDITDKNGSKITHIIVFDNVLYAMVANRKMGFKVCKLENEDNCDWKSFIVNGANRYVFNERVLAAVPFDGALYLANGVTESERNKPRFFSSTEFEIIRVYGNDDWDLIIGTPRFTPQGLKVPLSGLGPNIDDLSLDVLRNLFVYNNQLFIWYQDHSGFQILTSHDGENWVHIPQNLYGDNRQIKVCNTLSTPFGVILILDITDGDGNCAVELWRMTQT